MLVILGHTVMVLGYLIQGSLLYIALVPDRYDLIFVIAVLLMPYASRTIFGGCVFVMMSNALFRKSKHLTYGTSFGWLASVIRKKYALRLHYGILLLAPALIADIQKHLG